MRSTTIAFTRILSRRHLQSLSVGCLYYNLKLRNNGIAFEELLMLVWNLMVVSTVYDGIQIFI